MHNATSQNDGIFIFTAREASVKNKKGFGKGEKEKDQTQIVKTPYHIKVCGLELYHLSSQQKSCLQPIFLNRLSTNIDLWHTETCFLL